MITTATMARTTMRMTMAMTEMKIAITMTICR